MRNRLISRDFELLIVFGVFSLSPLFMNILAAACAHMLRVGPMCTAQAGTVSWLLDPCSPPRSIAANRG